MIEIIHEINGNPTNGPVNWQELELTVEREGNSVSLNFDSLEFEGADAEFIRSIFMSGLTGGTGMFEGIPYKVKVKDGNDLFLHDAYLDASTEATFLGCDRIICQMKQRNGRDWLTDVADGFSFAFLYDEGVITNADFVNIPYVRNYIPDGPILLTLSLSVFMMSKELYELIREIAEQTAELINAATPNVGVGVTIDVGDIIWAALKIIGRIVYAVFLVIAIGKMIAQIFEQLFPLKRYHKGMTYLKMFQKACEHLNLQFKSTILEGNYSDAVYMPVKDGKGFLAITDNYTGVTGLGGAGYPGIDEPIYTFGNFIRVMKEMFNADYRISNGIFRFERHDYFEQSNSYVIPDVFTDQERFKDDWSPNSDEFTANYNIVLRYDTMDQNTLDDQIGRVFQATLRPNVVVNPDLVIMKGLKQTQIPFAHGKRKNSLNAYEKVVKALAQATDALTGLFGSGTNYTSLVEARVGCLLLSSDQTTVPKILIMKGGKIAADQSKIHAKAFWDNFGSIDCFKPINGKHGQFIKFKNLTVPMCLKDFLSLVQNLNCDTWDARKAIIDRIRWLAYKEEAEIDFRIRELYTNNFKLTEIT
jgi:hypothetical protein